VRRHGGVAGVLADARLTDGQRQYLAAALGVVPPVPDLPVELPPGRRDAYPVDGERLTALTERLGLGSATEGLLAALVALTRQPPSD
jgi:hypothetical protein